MTPAAAYLGRFFLSGLLLAGALALPVAALATDSVSDSTSISAAKPLPIISDYTQQSFTDGRGRLTALYAPAAPTPGDRRSIKVLQAPLTGGGDLAGAQALNDALEGFRARAVRDCHQAEVATPKPTPSEGRAAAAVEIFCTGFDPIASDGRPGTVDGYLYARFEQLRDTLVVMLYQWRSETTGLAAVRAANLQSREVQPVLAEIRAALNARLLD